ncbi:hypothetical protein P691DRAFT_755995 [Macrolepiota fuliginosa MF-IS2]|uniref:Nonribosomal peptide synthetase 12 n=1 Tax=Macrolepiota fuliginosa MF-IS2 TaxID=1400762 RepID=A0A9P5XLK6_9AGAR|nr:hypothetical protein P691DRAFT_755995 [Macrolepiota fuliginosa MF-IS2]
MATAAPPTFSQEKYAAHDLLVEELAKEVAIPEPPATAVDASSVASSLEKEEDILAGFQDDILPKKENGKKTRFLRHQVFSLYRKLFGVVFLTNLAIFIWVLVRGTNALEVAGITVANLFVAILHRQDYVINAYFWLFTRVPHSAPFWVRAAAARVYHIGGLHSGCGVSGTIWFILFAGQATKELAHHEGTISVPTLVITYCVVALLIGILVFAHPELRLKFHNNFEMTHRFMGWTAVGLVWALIVLLTNDYRAPDVPLGKALIHSPHFWLIVIFTLSIALPWMRLRKYKIKSEILSNHCVRLYFDYATPPPGSFARISTAPLTEWHSFATIAVPEKKGYSMIISRAGDWTSKTIATPPSEIWVRGIPTWGMMSVAGLFRKVLFVATGSGIAPICPWLFSIQVPFRLLWTSPNVRQTFGDKLIDAIFEASPDSIIYDTRIHGKPDMVKLVYRVAKEYQPEAICVISNEKLTRKIVYGMVSRGIPAFGPIWDS